MAIPIKCQCGKALKVPDTAAGRAVKCPACSQSIKVPAAPGGSPAPAPEPAPAVSDDSRSMNELFDEEGFSEHVAAVCPACRNEMAAGAVLCTKCGFHIETGERLEKHKTAGVDIDHGTLALEKAALDMVKDKQLQATMLRGAGLPWWGLALVLFLLGSGLTIAVLTVNASRRIDESITFNPMGLFLMLAGVAFYLVAQGAFLVLVVHAFKTSTKQGLLTLLVPLYAFYYVYQHMRETWKLLFVTLLAGGIAGGLLSAAVSRGV
jgi:hypothetical protein